jgi:hypothetical protein
MKAYREIEIQLHNTTSTKRTSVVTFTPQLVQSRERISVPVKRGLGVPQNPSE